jgi:hypothetical protein
MNQEIRIGCHAPLTVKDFHTPKMAHDIESKSNDSVILDSFGGNNAVDLVISWQFSPSQQGAMLILHRGH